MSPSASAPRSRRRCSSSAIEGATMNTSTASGYRVRSWAAPCVSISSSTSLPSASAASSGRAGVPYMLPCTVAHSASSPRSSMVRNSRSVTKRKSTPFTSPGRGARVVAETEYARSGMHSRASRQSVVLPAPDGAETTKSVPRRPRRAPALLKILHLLADLLQDALGGQRGLAHLQVVGLRGHRVHLTVQLLDQEVERPADGPALVEQQRELREVRAQPRQLLGHVALVRPDRRLGHDARLVDGRLGQQRTQSLA